MHAFLAIASIFAPSWALQKRFDYWLHLLNQQTALELRGMKGGAEWCEVSRGAKKAERLLRTP